MSWSIAINGSASSTAAGVAAEIERLKGGCSEPEETIKNAAGGLIGLALSSFEPNMGVRLSAYGSQSADYSTDPPTIKSNALSITITPDETFSVERPPVAEEPAAPPAEEPPAPVAEQVLDTAAEAPAAEAAPTAVE